MFTLIFHQLLKMFLIMILAFICYRAKVINQEGNKNLSNLLLMVVNPCLVITTYQIDYDPRLVKGLLISFLAAFAAHIIAILIARLFISSANNPEYCLERFAAIYSNCGFIGIPLIYSILGSEGVFYITAYMTIFNLFTWTHGLILMEGRFSAAKLREGLLSPLVIATCIAMILFFFQLRIPETVLSSMGYVADMNTPLAMMIAGFSVAQADLKKIFGNLHIYRVLLLKLLIVPFAVMPLLVLTGIPSEIAYPMLIASACPTATTTTLLAIRYNKNYTYASEIFSVSTLLSMISIPFITYIAGFFFG